jgi:uncharacterized protein YxeA
MNVKIYRRFDNVDNLFLTLEIVQALTLIGILIALVIIVLQLREIASVVLFGNMDTGVENPDVQEPQEDYTQTGESLADILNKRLKDMFGEDYEKYMENQHGKQVSYDLENDFGILGVEVITDEDETKPKGDK